ncbi:thiamine monophosphate kinase [compost metagenome]
MLYGGEDYQLVGTAEGTSIEALAELFLAEGLELHVIGKVLASRKPDVTLRKRDGNVIPIGKRGYNHFNTSNSS